MTVEDVHNVHIDKFFSAIDRHVGIMARSGPIHAMALSSVLPSREDVQVGAH